ncbi:MAG: hypothetical protein ACOCWT_01970 [Desulfohalobiaceae bacterium]
MQDTPSDLRVGTRTHRIHMELLRLKQRLRSRGQGQALPPQGEVQPRAPEDLAGAIVDILV